MNELNDAIVKATTSSQALNEIYRQEKRQDPSLSLQKFGETIGIPSKGNLSQILNGRRFLPLKKVKSIGEVFGFSPNQVKLLALLVKKDREKSAEKVEVLKTQLSKLRKTLAAKSEDRYQSVLQIPLAMEVFSAFGLFECRCTADDLVNFFGIRRRPQVYQALKELVRIGYVLESEGVFELGQNEIMIRSEKRQEIMKEVIESSLQQAKTQLSPSFKKKNEALFLTSVISVKQQDYEQLLPQVRDKLESMQSELECESSDALIRFNVQIFSVGKK